MTMTGEHHITTLPDTVSEQAVYWFALLLDGSETGEDRQAFARWIDASPAHLDARSNVFGVAAPLLISHKVPKLGGAHSWPERLRLR